MAEAGEISLGQMMRQRHPGETRADRHDHARRDGDLRARPGRAGRGRDRAAGLDGSWEQPLHGSGYPRLYLGTASLRRVVDVVEWPVESADLPRIDALEGPGRRFESGQTHHGHPVQAAALSRWRPEPGRSAAGSRARGTLLPRIHVLTFGSK
jgi:hypothetical protein